MANVHHGLGGSLESVPNERALKGRRGVQIGDRIWNEELQDVMVAQMGKWVAEGLTLDTPTRVKKLAGHTFCLTGTAWAKRSDIVDMIRAEGGKFVPSMTRQVTILINAHAGLAADESSYKMKSAKMLGAKIISAHDLKKIFDGDVSLAVVLGDRKKKRKRKRKKVEPIDRKRHRQLVKETLANIESIAFGK